MTERPATNALMAKGVIRNEADLKKVVVEQETAPLDMVVRAINITLGTATRSTTTLSLTGRRRSSAGRRLQ